MYASIRLSAETDVLCRVFLSQPPTGGYCVLISFIPHPRLISRVIIGLNDRAIVNESAPALSAIQEQGAIIAVIRIIKLVSFFPLWYRHDTATVSNT